MFSGKIKRGETITKKDNKNDNRKNENRKNDNRKNDNRKNDNRKNYNRKNGNITMILNILGLSLIHI